MARHGVENSAAVRPVLVNRYFQSSIQPLPLRRWPAQWPMYRIRAPGISKKDLKNRWALPDRVFFACGACHVLAHAFLERRASPEMKVLWIRPDPGFTGNHIFIATDDWTFDFHGYAERQHFLDHAFQRARHLWPGWNGSVVELPRDVLVSEAKSRAIDGLWLREPRQFFHDALPRARAYVDRFPAPPALGKPRQRTFSNQ